MSEKDFNKYAGKQIEGYPLGCDLDRGIRWAADRIAELEAALSEAMDWNWLDNDMPSEVVWKCRNTLEGE